MEVTLNDLAMLWQDDKVTAETLVWKHPWETRRGGKKAWHRLGDSLAELGISENIPSKKSKLMHAFGARNKRKGLPVKTTDEKAKWPPIAAGKKVYSKTVYSKGTPANL